MKFLFFLLFVLFSFAASAQRTCTITYTPKDNKIEDFEIRDLITDRLLGTIDITKPGGNRVEIPLTGPMSASIKLGSIWNYQLLFLEPGETVQLVEQSPYLYVTSRNDPADALFNHLRYSINWSFLADIFRLKEAEPAAVTALVDSLVLARQEKIMEKSDSLSADALDFLQFQNRARAYNYLFHYGRVQMGLPAEDPFFSFVHEISDAARWSETLPHNLLYKYEHE